MPFGLERDIELRRAFGIGQIDRPHVGLRIESKGQHPAIGNLSDKRLHIRIIGAADRQAIKRNVGDEIEKALMQGLFGTPMLHMFGVDIGDNRDGRGQPVEGAVALIGLDHHPLALPHPRVGPIGMDDPAIDHGRVDPSGVKKRRDHGCGRGLPMCPRDGDVGFDPHQLGQHLRPADNGQAHRARRVELRITRLDGAGDHHDLCLFQVLRLLADEDFRAQPAQTLRDLRGFQIRALDLIPVVQQNLCNARHPDPADAHEMDRSQLGGKFGGGIHD